MRLALVSISILLCSTWVFAAAPPSALGEKGMVASDHELASTAGAIVLEQGGNAVDAMIATVLAAGVVQPAGSGLGGGGFAVWHDTKDANGSLDFREVAPSKSTYIKRGLKTSHGGLAVAVPGEGRAYGVASAFWLSSTTNASSSRNPKKGFKVGPQLKFYLDR